MWISSYNICYGIALYYIEIVCMITCTRKNNDNKNCISNMLQLYHTIPRAHNKYIICALFKYADVYLSIFSTYEQWMSCFFIVMCNVNKTSLIFTFNGHNKKYEDKTSFLHFCVYENTGNVNTQKTITKQCLTFTSNFVSKISKLIHSRRFQW